MDSTRGDAADTDARVLELLHAIDMKLDRLLRQRGLEQWGGRAPRGRGNAKPEQWSRGRGRVGKHAARAVAEDVIEID